LRFVDDQGAVQRRGLSFLSHGNLLVLFNGSRAARRNL
jgi:hypothetical protein